MDRTNGIAQGIALTAEGHSKIAKEVADIGVIVCMVIFAVCFIAAIVLGALAFAVGIIAIPAAIGVLVFLVPAIARVISISLERPLA